MVPGLGWDHFLTIFWSPEPSEDHFFTMLSQGVRKQFFHNFPGFIAVEPGALITLVRAGHGWQWPTMAGNGRPPRLIRAAPSTESDFKKTRKMVKKLFLDPLESMVKKWSFDGSGPPQEMCPKSCQKIVKNDPSRDLGIKKWSKNCPSQDLGPLKHH